MLLLQLLLGGSVACGSVQDETSRVRCFACCSAKEGFIFCCHPPRSPRARTLAETDTHLLEQQQQQQLHASLSLSLSLSLAPDLSSSASNRKLTPDLIATRSQSDPHPCPSAPPVANPLFATVQ